MKEEKYTLEEIKKMIDENNFFAYDTPLGDQADEHASDYDYDEYGTALLMHRKLLGMPLYMGYIGLSIILRGSNIPFKFLYMNQDLC